MRLPKVLTAITLGGCSPAMQPAQDAGPDGSTDVRDAGTDGGYDAGYDAGAKTDAGVGTPWGDAGCVLPSDFNWDAGLAEYFADSACGCKQAPDLFHCYEEHGPRCISWACAPALDRNDGGYRYLPDGGIECLC